MEDKFAVHIDVTIDNVTVANSLKNGFPSKADSKVWPDEYGTPEVTSLGGGLYQVLAEVRFNLEADRDSLLSTLVSLANTHTNKITEGKILKHTCDHKYDKKDRKGCVDEVEWSK